MSKTTRLWGEIQASYPQKKSKSCKKAHIVRKIEFLLAHFRLIHAVAQLPRWLVLFRYCMFYYKYKLLLRLFSKFNDLDLYVFSLFFSVDKKELQKWYGFVRVFLSLLLAHLSNVFTALGSLLVYFLYDSRTLCPKDLFNFFPRRYRDFMKDCPTGELKQEVFEI